MAPINLRDQLLGQARREFAPFYSAASLKDGAIMDALVMANAALVVAMNAPRDNLSANLRTELERATDANELLFTDLREELRACDTFCALPDEGRAAIERSLFDVKPPPLIG